MPAKVRNYYFNLNEKSNLLLGDSGGPLWVEENGKGISIFIHSFIHNVFKISTEDYPLNTQCQFGLVTWCPIYKLCIYRSF